MKINFSPVRMDKPLQASVAGDTLTLNGTPYNFGPLAEGAALPCEAVTSEWLASNVTRSDGEIVLTLILPVAIDAPEAALWPAPVTVTSGPVTLPGASQ